MLHDNEDQILYLKKNKKKTKKNNKSNKQTKKIGSCFNKFCF